MMKWLFWFALGLITGIYLVNERNRRMQWNVLGLSTNNNNDMSVNNAFPGSWSDVSQQEVRLDLIMAEGNFFTQSEFNLFASATYPEINLPANSPFCLIAYEAVGVEGDAGNKGIAIGSIRRNATLDYIGYHWGSKRDACAAATTAAMTGQQFVDALVQVLKV
jgi:hypothetical protein